MTAYNDLMRSLSLNVQNGVLNDSIIAALLPDGRPHEGESALWDYKLDLPKLSDHPTQLEKDQHKAEIAELIKDVASFYNIYGGYILFGVADKGADRIKGCSGSLDIGDLNQRVEAALGQSVECLIKFFSLQPGDMPLAVLLIPRRPDQLEPASFKRAAPADNAGKKAYNSNDVYGRFRDRCRPATANSIDWRFLHGPRTLENNAQPTVPARKILASLPPRDPELVKFVGREKYLEKLRQWIGDRRSPVKLLTGIGGLGKTSIAYKFVEELVDLSAADVEKLIWLSAKERTFSAIRHKIVEIGRTDFHDAVSLYEVILEKIGYPMEGVGDDPSTEDYIEAIVEAIICYNCLVIVDDIDSFSSEIQKDVVFSLTACANRTVDGARQPSRFLFTSRIDQGFAPGHVIKVEGFDLDEFKEYVAEVAAALSISLPKKIDFESFRVATSGSPLFTSSILRLLRFGNNFDQSLEKWHGSEGVDVRRFAFQRELEELPVQPARVLYAVCLLGETSQIELSQVLELSQTAIADAISRLQSFHLLAIGSNQSGGPAIVAPDDVVLTKDVLKTHLADSASHVERACGRVRNDQHKGRRDIAAGIGRVISLWREDRHSEALIEAERLDKLHVDNPDLQCLLGSALVKPGIEKWHEADRAFLKAHRLKSKRPELLENWVFARRNLNDWRGLLELTDGKMSARGGFDWILRTNLHARLQLIDAAFERGDLTRVIELSREGIGTISTRLFRDRHSNAQDSEMRSARSQLAHKYFEAMRRKNPRSDDQLFVFDALYYIHKIGVFEERLIKFGLEALKNWWEAVERRPDLDERARDILRVRLEQIEQMERDAVLKKLPELAVTMRNIRLDLAYRGAKHA